jgi:hypothetical protein
LLRSVQNAIQKMYCAMSNAGDTPGFEYGKNSTASPKQAQHSRYSTKNP